MRVPNRPRGRTSNIKTINKYGIVGAICDSLSCRTASTIAEYPANTLSKGPHTLTLRVVSSGGDCYYESPGIPIVIE